MAILERVFELLHWVHLVVLPILVLVHFLAWQRGGFWMPWYIHVLAVGVFFAGIIITATLPEPTNPDPTVQLLYPLIFPGICVVATYVIAIFGGFIHILQTNQPESQSAKIPGFEEPDRY